MLKAKVKVILFDFDGVIIDSMRVRDEGFKHIFSQHPPELLKKLISYHQQNGGMSRFHKIRYFYEKLLKQPISTQKIERYADEFSLIMRQELVKQKYLIRDTVEFIKQYYQNYKMHIVSGSEVRELRYLCRQLDISRYFVSIHGSPTPKAKLVERVVSEYEYKLKEIVLVGDSINDLDAARQNNISFIGYNNFGLRDIGVTYIGSFDEFQALL